MRRRRSWTSSTSTLLAAEPPGVGNVSGELRGERRAAGRVAATPVRRCAIHPPGARPALARLFLRLAGPPDGPHGSLERDLGERLPSHGDLEAVDGRPREVPDPVG